MHIARVLVVTALPLACDPVEPPPPPPPPPPVPTVDCAPSNGGLAIAGVEGEPGYDEELAALELQALPAQLPVDGLSDFERDAVAFMLEQDAPAVVERDAALQTDLGRAVLGAYAAADAAGDAGGLDFAFLRRGLHRFYACERGFPATLDEFRERVYDFTLDPVDQTVESTVKNLPRRIRRSGSAGVFVAETMLPGDVVRETEILLVAVRADDDIEFIEYDEQGKLRAASAFATSTGGEAVGAVPFTCIACHGYREVSPSPP